MSDETWVRILRPVLDAREGDVRRARICVETGIAVLYPDSRGRVGTLDRCFYELLNNNTQPPTCRHEFITYTGFTETYRYCKRCDAKDYDAN